VPLTVQQVIDLLKTFPPDTRVLVMDHDGCLEPCIKVALTPADETGNGVAFVEVGC
jgi:hypothetical protein